MGLGGKTWLSPKFQGRLPRGQEEVEVQGQRRVDGLSQKAEMCLLQYSVLWKPSLSSSDRAGTEHDDTFHEPLIRVRRE